MRLLLPYKWMTNRVLVRAVGMTAAMTMALIGLLSAAALLLCVSAIGGALYCRMKGKGYVDMTGMDIEMNGIVREGMAESGFSHIVECKDSDEEVEITIEEE